MFTLLTRWDDGERCLPAPVYEQQYRFISRLFHSRSKLLEIGHRLVIDFLNYVAALQSTISEIAVGVDTGDNNATSASRQIQLIGDFWS